MSLNSGTSHYCPDVRHVPHAMYNWVQVSRHCIYKSLFLLLKKKKS
jgi:hypothetical protein